MLAKLLACCQCRLVEAPGKILRPCSSRGGSAGNVDAVGIG